MFASWVRPDSTSLPMTTQAGGGVARGHRRLRLTGIAQQRDQRLVGRRHRVVGELLRAHPGQRLAFPRPRHALPAPAQKQRHQQMEPLISVRGEGERRKAGGGDVDAQLLLAARGSAPPRASRPGELAAGELPQPGHPLALRPAGQQHPAVAVDQRAGGDQQQRLRPADPRRRALRARLAEQIVARRLELPEPGARLPRARKDSVPIAGLRGSRCGAARRPRPGCRSRRSPPADRGRDWPAPSAPTARPLRSPRRGPRSAARPNSRAARCGSARSTRRPTTPTSISCSPSWPVIGEVDRRCPASRSRRVEAIQSSASSRGYGNGTADRVRDTSQSLTSRCSASASSGSSGRRVSRSVASGAKPGGFAGLAARERRRGFALSSCAAVMAAYRASSAATIGGASSAASSAARQRYQAARERCGAHASPITASARGFGCASSPCSRR